VSILRLKIKGRGHQVQRRTEVIIFCIILWTSEGQTADYLTARTQCTQMCM